MNRCAICTHPDRDEINRHLTQATLSGDAVAQRYGMSPSSVDRHKARHLRLSVQAVQERANALEVVKLAVDLHGRAIRLLDEAERVLAEQPAARSVQAAAAAVREVRGSLDLLARLIVTDAPAPDPAANAWLDDQLTAAVARLALPQLEGGDQVEDAVILPPSP